MPKKIKLNGPVIGDGSTWLYDWLGMPCISASKLSKELDDARGEDVELYVNSPGGSVSAGSEVYTILKEYTGKKTGKVTGFAASAASFFLMGVDVLMMSPTSQLMIHNASTWTEGDKNTHSSNVEMLKSTDVAITNAYRLKTGKSTDELLDLMNKTTWMNPQMAVELGFADGILFDETNSLIAVSNSLTSGEIPPDVEAKLRDVVISAMLKGGVDVKSGSNGEKNPFEGLDLSAIFPNITDLTQLTNSIEECNSDQEPETKEEPKNMDLDQLKAQYPDIFNAAFKEGQDAERSRITALNALANSPGAAEIVAAAIENGTTAGEAAIKIVQASAARVTEQGDKRLKDSQNSGAHQVESDEAPLDQNQDAVSDAEAEAIKSEIDNMLGGRK
ncbi:head maturation protease, ClpP-related [Paenibacillus agilis]|uniref:ATP-dependent Clp protease proteolytic subunit n=1 Tax=Paenibacillus agilis TaxID=3020863 RepID=A0A559IZI3_9BACL|nr:head maturation protease, ClpP-related [Paenibacillus agilis]TVX93039.1 Clp protease ClpP [Paenibacillus agilis]